MCAETIIQIALRHNEIHSLSYAMNYLIADYIEGENDSAKDLFNKYFICKLTKPQQQQVINDCVFEYFAIKLANRFNLIHPYKKVGEHEYECLLDVDPRN